MGGTASCPRSFTRRLALRRNNAPQREKMHMNMYHEDVAAGCSVQRYLPSEKVTANNLR